MSGSLAAGVDLGGTHMQIGIVDEAGRIVAEQRMKTNAEGGETAVLDRIAEGVEQACEDAACLVNDLCAVGIAAPGVIDLPRGVVLEAPNLGWEQTPVRDLLAQRLGRPVVLDNDVSGAVWGEFHHGAGRGHSHVLGVWVGTGVGGGLVLNGHLYRAPVLSGVEIGWTVIDPAGTPGYRTVEELCSRTGMSRLIMDRLDDHPDSPLQECRTAGVVPSAALAAALEADDPLATDVAHAAADWLGLAIANWVTLLALDAVVVGGGISESLGQTWLARVRARFDAEVFPEEARACELRLTELRNNAGLLGAAMLARGE